MAEAPQQLPFDPAPGEWNLIGTITPPPTTGQMRMDNAVQTSATKMWFNKTSATNIDVSTSLAGLKKGMEVTIANKSDGTKWQTYLINNNPVDGSTYVELPVLWKRGGGSTLPAQRTLLTAAIVVTNAPVTGLSMVAGASGVTVATSSNVSVEVGGMAAKAEAGRVEIAGQLINFDFAFPFEGRNYTSPGLSKREWYAGQALQGFIAKGIAHNLIGTVSGYCFKVADSMIAEEARQTSIPTVPTLATAPNPQPSTAPITHDERGRKLSRAVWPRPRQSSG